MHCSPPSNRKPIIDTLKTALILVLIIIKITKSPSASLDPLSRTSTTPEIFQRNFDSWGYASIVTLKIPRKLG